MKLFLIVCLCMFGVAALANENEKLAPGLETDLASALGDPVMGPATRCVISNAYMHMCLLGDDPDAAKFLTRRECGKSLAALAEVIGFADVGNVIDDAVALSRIRLKQHLPVVADVLVMETMCKHAWP